MSREYYSFWFRLDARDGYLIYISNETDGFVTEDNGNVPYFLYTGDLLQYASALDLTVDAESPNLTDLDILDTWLESNDGEKIDCNTFLEAWNLFDDLSKTVSGNFDPERKKTQKIYNKLFWGNNLPAVTPDGEHYIPSWTKGELNLMRKVLGEGLVLFRERTTCVKTPTHPTNQ